MSEGSTGIYTKGKPEDVLQRIRTHPFFAGFPERFLPILADCAMPVEFEAGQTIFNTGDLANRLYLIESGEIHLQAEGAEGRMVTLQTLGPGQVLGWSWLFPPHYWRFSAQTVGPVRAIFLYGTRIRELGETDPSFGYPMMKQVAQIVIQRLQDTRERLLKRQLGA
ncbi:MAG TPA: Crp/Fnr family transcriptional regulator [Verrucomicrobiales bacterium]|nr:Crp/Fnr family transcriptional regulator [Verrucomicrobiales bacterium]